MSAVATRPRPTTTEEQERYSEWIEAENREWDRLNDLVGIEAVTLLAVSELFLETGHADHRARVEVVARRMRALLAARKDVYAASEGAAS